MRDDRRADLKQAILDLLPQTQCTRCGHPACEPYADAILDGEAINRCPPGGQRTIDALAILLERPSLALDSTRGVEQPPRVAFIREDECIGCTKCIQACPVDAILGAAKLMHTVIADECTGCELCIEPCPVDCIDLLPVERDASPTAERQRSRHARGRFLQRERRAVRRAEERRTARSRDPAAPRIRPLAERVRMVEDAVARVRAKKLAGSGAHRSAVDDAIERARRSALLRARATPATAPVTATPDTPQELQRKLAVRENKLARAREKLAASTLEQDAETRAALVRSIALHEKLIAELREQLQLLERGNDTTP